jgi:hypothetical protein
VLRRTAGVGHPAPRRNGNGKEDSRQNHRSGKGKAHYAKRCEADSGGEALWAHAFAEGPDGVDAASAARAAAVRRPAPPPFTADQMTNPHHQGRPAAVDAFVNEIARCFGAPPVSVVILRQQEEAKMAFEQKDNSGAVFVNDRKDQDTHPDRTGTARIDGTDYWVNGWLRKTKDGKPYLALSFKEKEPKQDKLPASNKTIEDDLKDGIPF